VVVLSIVMAVPFAACAADATAWTKPESAARAAQTLALTKLWVQGTYSNRRQAEADMADSAVPDEQKHRLMHQRFIPIPVSHPWIPGHLVFQQASSDGSFDPETIFRAGLLQFLVDEQTGTVRQRELNFRDPVPWKGSTPDIARLMALTPADFAFDAGCDFILGLEADGRSIAGPMPAGTCRIYSQGLRQYLVADDAVFIGPREYGFKGRFLDGAGRVVWGNASPEPVRLERVDGVNFKKSAPGP
jgi:hypothetical protein